MTLPCPASLSSSLPSRTGKHEPQGLMGRRSVKNELKLTSDAATTFELASTSSSSTCHRRPSARPRLSSSTEVGGHISRRASADGAAVSHIQQITNSQSWLYTRNETLEREIKELRAWVHLNGNTT